jgi:4-oxalocrotonate tautomerase
MTLVRITLIEGRSDAQKAAMFLALTQAVHESLGVAAETVRIALDEIPARHFAVGGIAKIGPSSTSPAT